MAGHFERKYRQDADPWRYRDSWYERRKYAITLASLPRRRYGSAWEPGCSIGELTVLLHDRVQLLDAGDASGTAVAAARSRTRDLPGVTVDRAELPYRPPRSRYDLVVLSEVLYYLPAAGRELTLGIVDEIAAPGADLVVVHWRHHPEDAWEAGERVNEQVRVRSGWQPVARHEERDFVLDVLTAR